MTIDEYRNLPPNSFPGWIKKECYREGEFIGMFLQKHSEVHIVPAVKKALSRKNIIEYLTPIFNRYGFVTTSLLIGSGETKLMQKLGFEKTWEDQRLSYWMLNKLPFEKKNVQSKV